MRRQMNRPKPNDFRFLVDEDDDEQQQEDEDKPIETKNEFQQGGKRKPLTLSQSFARSLPKQKIEKISQLADAVDDAIRIKLNERTLYCEKYELYDKYEPKRYDELLEKRLSFLDSRHDEEFIQDVLQNLPENIKPAEIRDLILATAKKLDHKKPVGHGALFLIDVLYEERPELFTPELFEVSNENVQKIGPVVLWLLGRSLREESQVKFTTNDFVNLFLGQFLNPTISVSAAFSVCASHILMKNVTLRSDKKLTSFNCAEILQLKSRRTTNRDNHVLQVLLPLLDKSNVTDPENFAKELMTHYPNCDNKQVLSLFMGATKQSQRFLQGWVQCHDQLIEPSTKYLNTVSQTFPAILEYFPLATLKASNNEFAALTLRKKTLVKSSIRFTVILALAAVAYFVQMK
ncbi:hypothetical protein TRFO_21660 [Tritrichomonas foetus]|uniref:Uncharacterized protein n=1 Tax=Tritrichomonas foetus TaxID=1144522 RepID=A0A1J4KHY0_9EUKA|nr:hypothetical protein TRFO_21660 [Tritrichomonas foetus]|eukprot:OHT09428.1 hypothetical protein TRFO_21660 [Tritrichomonas foetus]